MIAVYGGNEFLTPFEVYVYKCLDLNCLTCSFDLPNLVKGSMICTICKNSYTLHPATLQCMNCGDGFLQGNETCDDGGLGGCSSIC